MELTRDQILELAVQSAAQAATTGSYAQRNPNLGRMVRCPHCRLRRREQEACCSAKYLITNSGDVPRSFYAKKRKIPRLSRNRPPLFEVHDRLVQIERCSKCEHCGQSKEDHIDWKYCTPGNFTQIFMCREQEGISGIVEAQIKQKRKARAAKKRSQQRQSRKINRRNK